MTLHETLLKATSEEAVKAAYIKALGLKNVQSNLISSRFEFAYAVLAAKLRPKVHEYGFLK